MFLLAPQEFFIEARGLHWPTYLKDYCSGTKKFILKEDDTSLPAARAHINRYDLRVQIPQIYVSSL